MFSCVFTVFLSAILSDVFIGLQVREALQELPKYRKTWQRRLKHSLLAHEEQNFVTLWKNPQFVHSPTSPLGLSSTLSCLTRYWDRSWGAGRQCSASSSRLGDITSWAVGMVFHL